MYWSGMIFTEPSCWKTGSFVEIATTPSQLSLWSKTVFLHICGARHLRDFKVEVTFNDGRRGVADLRDSLIGKVFEPLRDVKVFGQLRVDPELDTIVWPNGADFAPEFIYFQAFKHEPDLQERFKSWGYVA
jgi:hypothetical protein